MKKCLFTLSTILFTLSTIAQSSLMIQIQEVETKNTLSEAMVFIQPLNDYFIANENGQVFLNQIPFGLYEIIVTKEGYEEKKVSFNFKENAQKLVVSLQPSTDGSGLFKSLITNEVLVTATRASDKTPSTQTTIKHEELQEENLGKDLTYLLAPQPSVVSFSDAGNGVGYTGIRIRGTDMTRINFTINGVPYNDAESQAVFLVDVPDIASSVQDIQIQRGVGTSTNGAASFGASVNINTQFTNDEAYLRLNNAFGSFKTIKNTLQFGTGLINNQFSLDGRLSHIQSNGYIDRASAKLWSYYLSGAYHSDKGILRFNHFSGIETTYQAWNGVDETTLQTDRTFNISGTDWLQRATPYDNEIDQYKQDHYQLFYTHQYNEKIQSNVGLFYTRGKGYFEQFKVGANFSDYQFEPLVSGNDTISSTDLIRRRWLDNHFYGAVFSIMGKHNKLEWTLGGAWNQYDGMHYGEVIWARFASASEIRDRYYENNGQKTDFNIYAKANYSFTKKWNAYLDLQYRTIGYNVSGIDNDGQYVFIDEDYHFFNPKLGVMCQMNPKQKLYASFAVANKEPARSDFLDNAIAPKAETLYDWELGYQIRHKKWSMSTNAYLMYYKNQLVLDGRLNDVGAALRTNVDQSYRSGIETAATFKPMDWMEINGNVTWSVNEINRLTDESGVQHDKTKIAFSPQWIGFTQLILKPFQSVEIAWNTKFVGNQFIDNTTNTALQLDRYYQSDIRLSYLLEMKRMKSMQFIVLLNNITNREIVSNAYVYGGYGYYFPQAKFNWNIGVNCNF